MADIEKVIKGLEYCTEGFKCNECPYKKYQKDDWCKLRMEKDVLELLKVSVSQNVADQFRWERDTAIQQLSEIGKGLGEKMDDIEKIVRCKDCKHYTLQPGKWECDLYEWAHEPDWFCHDGERE